MSRTLHHKPPSAAPRVRRPKPAHLEARAERRGARLALRSWTFVSDVYHHAARRNLAEAASLALAADLARSGFVVIL